jgi:hypothetical protein
LMLTANVPHRKEVVAHSMKRPADILLIRWDHGRDIAVDFTVTNPLAADCYPLSLEGAKRHLANAERDKLVKEGPMCAAVRWGFSPVALSPWGMLGPSGKELLRDVTKRIVGDLPLEAHAGRAQELRQCLSLALMREVARQLSLRCSVLDELC